MMDDELIATFQANGFIVLKNLIEEDLVDALRDEYERLKRCRLYREGSRASIWVHNLLEVAPHLAIRAVNRGELLVFLEAIMGPFVQIDSSVLAGFPTVATSHQGEVAAWHRDRLFGDFSVEGIYVRPHSVIMTIYLSDLTSETGPLRVIPNSHKHREVVPSGSSHLPHPDEELLCTRKGDAILFHDGMLHSGTANVSGKDRCFFGVTFNMTWMRQEDNFAGPNCWQLIRKAEQDQDYRLLRLLGVDRKQHRRLNSGLVLPSRGTWERWAEEDSLSR